MALVTSIYSRPQEQTGRHPTEVECGYLVVQSSEGPILQLTTFGSSTRAMPGKASQTMQFDRQSATQLRQIIDQVFPSADL